jgi:hypothetical protein
MKLGDDSYQNAGCTSFIYECQDSKNKSQSFNGYVDES